MFSWLDTDLKDLWDIEYPGAVMFCLGCHSLNPSGILSDVDPSVSVTNHYIKCGKTTKCH